MIKKTINYIIKDFKENYKLLILTVLFFILFLVELDYVVYSPGSLENLKDRIDVENSYEVNGSYNLTYVTSRSGNIPTLLASFIIKDWDIVSIDDMRLDNENYDEIIKRNQLLLKETSYNAIIAAFKEANMPYEITSTDVSVHTVYDYAKTTIKVGDIIKSIDGIDIKSFDELSNIIQSKKENDELKITVIRNEKEVKCSATITKIEDRKVIGIGLIELKNVKTTPNVNYIFKDNESGSSRGFMCALDIYDKITEYDLSKGRIIAGTGSIDADGNIGTISGVKYKLKGAVKNKADIFIVPSENYEEAIKIKEEENYDIEIIKAYTLHGVIEELSK